LDGELITQKPRKTGDKSENKIDWWKNLVLYMDKVFNLLYVQMHSDKIIMIDNFDIHLMNRGTTLKHKNAS
jgi:hypothetical protein